MLKPFMSYKVTSIYGQKRTYTTTKGEVKTDIHNGVDLVGAHDNVMASAYGKVIFTTEDDGTGAKTVVVAYNNQAYYGCTLLVLYTHLAEIKVKKNQVVSNTTILGVQGSTGNVTGKHLHVSCYLIPPHIWKKADGTYYVWSYKTRYDYEIDPNKIFEFYKEV